ncbi:MAG: DnaB-like helicase C-terminal domain-containing protein [Candidatus Bathyarchaeia archaeon]
MSESLNFFDIDFVLLLMIAYFCDTENSSSYLDLLKRFAVDAVDREMVQLLSGYDVKTVDDLRLVLLSKSESLFNVKKERLIERLREVESFLRGGECSVSVLRERIEEALTRYQLLKVIEMVEQELKKKRVGRYVNERLIEFLRTPVCGVSVDGFRKGYFDEELTEKLEREIEGITFDRVYTGLLTFDSVVGGLRIGTFCVVLAGTSMGKTAFMIYLSAMSSLQGYNVLFLTLEDLREVVLQRFDRLFFGDMLYEERCKLMERLKMFSGQIYVEYLNNPALVEVERLIGRYVSERGVRVVVVDYADLLDVGGKREEWFEIGLVYRRLLEVLQKYNILLITGSQATREVMQAKNISLVHMSRSFRKCEVAHYVFGLIATREEREEGKVRVSLLKNKFGEKGITVSCKVDWRRCWFTEIM